MPTGMLLNFDNVFQINTTPAATETLAPVAKGITSFDVSFNEETDQTRYMDGDGWGATTVTGGQVTLSFSGHRVYGDAAQDWIFSNVLNLGTTRETTFSWTMPDGKKISGPCTVASIEGPSGDAGAKGEISFEIHFNGKPTLA